MATKEKRKLDALARELNGVARDYAGREFQHYSGKRYRVIDLGLDSETLQPVVFYESIPLVTEDGERAPVRFTQPLHRFIAEVADPKKKGAQRPRFAPARKREA